MQTDADASENTGRPLIYITQAAMGRATDIWGGAVHQSTIARIMSNCDTWFEEHLAGSCSIDTTCVRKAIAMGLPGAHTSHRCCQGATAERVRMSFED